MLSSLHRLIVASRFSQQCTIHAARHSDGAHRRRPTADRCQLSIYFNPYGVRGTCIQSQTDSCCSWQCQNACTTVAECSARRQPLPLLSGAMWHSHFSARAPVDPRSVWKCRGSSSRGWELLNVAAAVAIRCSEARGNLGCAGTGSALHETIGVLIDFEFEAKSPLGLQQCKDHASPLAQFCTMWAAIVNHRKHRLPKVTAGTAGNLLEQLTHSCRW